MTTITISGNPGATFSGITQYMLLNTAGDRTVNLPPEHFQHADSTQIGGQLYVDPSIAELSFASGSRIAQAVFLFPSLASLPSGVTITDARLSLNPIECCSDGLPQAYVMTRLLRAVALPTWNSYSNVQDEAGNWTRLPWQNPGAFGPADRASVVSARGMPQRAPFPPNYGSTLLAGANGVETFPGLSGYFDLAGSQLVADVQAIVDGGPNYGWVVHKRDYQATDGHWTCFWGNGADLLPYHAELNVGAVAQTGRRPILTVSYA